MSIGCASAALGFAFASLHSGLWGVGWSAVDGKTTFVLGEGDSVRTLAAEVIAGSVQGEWKVLGEGSELVLEPIGPAVAAGGEDERGGLDQLCRARGRLGLQAGEVEVDSLGWRQARNTLAGIDWGTIRQAAAWFGPEDGIALTALRPRAAAEHGGDLLEAAVIGSEQSAVAEDPRLSTTYAADGRPQGAGVELWLARQDPDELYPLRASGLAVGPEATWSQDGVELRAELFKWYSRGREGAGVYLLGRRR